MASSTCFIARPAPQDLFDRTLNLFSANVLGGGDVVPDSNEWYVVSNDYFAQETFYSIADQQWRETNPREACCDNLVRMAADLGIYPRPATYARGYVKIEGTPGSALSANLRVLFGESTYKVDTGQTVPATMPDSGFVILRMVALDAGPAGNGLTVGKNSGTLTSSYTGISNTVTVFGSHFCGGKDAETCEQFRTRVLHRISHAHRANFKGITEDLTEYPCVTRLVHRSCSCCTEKGRLDLFVFMDETFAYGIPPQSVLDDMGAWYFGTPQGFGLGVADFGIEGTFYAAQPITVDISITDLPCTSAEQMELVRRRVAQFVNQLDPGVRLCVDVIKAIVIQVIGVACDMAVKLTVAGRNMTPKGDFEPGCDELPKPGVVTVKGGSLAL